MSITAARLQAEVGADTTGFDAGMKHADQTVASAPSKWGRALKVGAGVGLGIAAGFAVKGLAGAIGAGFDSLKRQGVVVAQTNAVLKSTGAVSHETAAGIRDLSNAIEDKTSIDDKQVQAGANMLLTFTNIRNEVGKGNDIFTQSVGILADMSTAMGTDMKTGAIQLGKALNDPLTGITALTRVGVTFSAQQKEQIKNFVEAGRVADAQKVILAELNKEFGGSGAAFAATDAGKAAKFQDAIENIQQSIATGLLPVVTRVRDSLTGFLSDPATLGQAEALGNAIAGIFSEDNLRTAANLMTTAAGAISTAIHLFSSLPPQVQALAVGAIALKKITGIGPLDIVKGASGLLKIAFERGATPASPLFVSDVTGGLTGGGGAVPAAAGGIGKLGKVFLAAESIAAIGAVIETQQSVSAANSNLATGVSQSVNNQITGGASLADLQKSLAAVDQGIADINNVPFNVLVSGDALDTLKTQDTALRAQLAILQRGYPLMTGTEANTGKAADDIAGVAVAVGQSGNKLVERIDRLHAAFSTDIHALTTATKANDIQKAAKAIAADINKGVGSAAGTKGVVADLKLKLTQTDDPKTRAVLQAAIKSVEAKLPNREWVSGEFKAAAAIEKSSESTKAKIIDLTAIQRTLRDRGDTHAASLIGQKVTEMKNRVAQAARAAGEAAAAATRAKKWHFTNLITANVQVQSEVSLHRFSSVSATAASRGKSYVA
jgi:hypothetical protein